MPGMIIARLKGSSSSSLARGAHLMMKHDSLAEPEPITIIRRPEVATSHRPRLAEAVRAGLLSRPKTLPWEYFYDANGSALFEQICELPEYYLTRTEDAILRDHAPEMVAGL